jgi:hypothetical protein
MQGLGRIATLVTDDRGYWWQWWHRAAAQRPLSHELTHAQRGKGHLTEAIGPIKTTGQIFPREFPKKLKRGERDHSRLFICQSILRGSREKGLRSAGRAIKSIKSQHSESRPLISYGENLPENSLSAIGQAAPTTNI